MTKLSYIRNNGGANALLTQTNSAVNNSNGEHSLIQKLKSLSESVSVEDIIIKRRIPVSKKRGKSLGAQVKEISQNISIINGKIRNSNPRKIIPAEAVRPFYEKISRLDGQSTNFTGHGIISALNLLRDKTVPSLLNSINEREARRQAEDSEVEFSPKDFQAKRKDVVHKLRVINSALKEFKSRL